MTTTGSDQLDCIDPTAYGETYGFDHVMRNSIQRMSAFPDRGGGHDDVVWEQLHAHRLGTARG